MFMLMIALTWRIAKLMLRERFRAGNHGVDDDVKRARLKRSSTLDKILFKDDTGESPKVMFSRRFSMADGNKRHFRVLCLDGGGVRGMYTARILQRLVDECPDLLDNIDLIAGSSTGALIGALLSLGHSPKKITDIYRVSCPKIFQSQGWRRFNPFASRYQGLHKLSVFNQIVGDAVFSELSRYIIVTAYCTDGVGDTRGLLGSFYSSIRGWRPALFSNLPRGASNVEPDTDLLVRDAAMRSTAAPSYFPIYQGYCDGSVFANNPSLCALARAMAAFPQVATLDNFVILSLGTGANDLRIPGKGHDWGLWQWAPWLVDLLFDSTDSSIDMNMRMLLGERYIRLNDVLPRRIELDDVDSIEELISFADAVDVSEALVFIRKYIYDSPVRQRSNSMPNAALRQFMHKGGSGSHRKIFPNSDEDEDASDEYSSKRLASDGEDSRSASFSRILSRDRSGSMDDRQVPPV
eukprot:m.166884 g.166884  ORF g.166884 m.166884 type:complete len:465 (-) comp17183_c1_seq1:164-1558(-)